MVRWRLEISLSLDFYEFTRLDKESSRFLRAFKFFKLSQTGLNSGFFGGLNILDNVIIHHAFFLFSRRYGYTYSHVISYNILEIFI